MISLFCSFGHSKEVATRYGLSAISVMDDAVYAQVNKNDIVVFFCPAYGDAELPESMERFLRWLVTRNKKYLICEIGNVFGFETSFGVAKIIRCCLDEIGWEEIGPSLMLDSEPEIDWNSFETWKGETYALLNRCENSKADN
jgi:hypothetical protein